MRTIKDHDVLKAAASRPSLTGASMIITKQMAGDRANDGLKIAMQAIAGQMSERRARSDDFASYLDTAA